MMHIRYTLKSSVLHGIGLFAGQDIAEGQVIYTASPALDLNITRDQFEALDQKEQDEVRWWGFFDEPSQMWHVDFDVSKFINHSYDSNVAQQPDYAEAYLIAKRTIRAGDELTQNYLEFESPADLERRGIPPVA